jgi:hypothetical protein
VSDVKLSTLVDSMKYEVYSRYKPCENVFIINVSETVSLSLSLSLSSGLAMKTSLQAFCICFTSDLLTDLGKISYWDIQ